jgi:hypothetical protein
VSLAQNADRWSQYANSMSEPLSEEQLALADRTLAHHLGTVIAQLGQLDRPTRFERVNGAIKYQRRNEGLAAELRGLRPSEDGPDFGDLLDGIGA